ncbi:MAG: beta-phosphoglucomutase [Kiritimatiellaceae bacterium]|nr:beta-phosphoglucomutase [Kiritimatiellaceae bacterium]
MIERNGGAEWLICESVYHPANERVGGTQFCIGNGLMGLRGSYEELGTKEVQGLFAAGVFRKSIERQFCTADTFCRKKYIFNEELMPTPEEIYLIQNLPDPLYCKIWIDGKPFRMWDGSLLEYNRTLDLKTGTLHRTVRWDNGEGKITSLHFRRFCSMAQRHLIAQEISITPENWSGEVRIESGIDASLNIEYVESVLQNSSSGLLMKSVVVSSGTDVFQCLENRLSVNGKLFNVWENELQLRRYKKIAVIQVKQGETLTLEKFSTLYSTQDENPEQSAVELAQKSAEAGFDVCHAESSRAWEKLWEQADIQIEGDVKAQQRIRFALFHLIIASPQTDSRVSIGAKALSGQGYSGHVFWDTDINLAPFYQWVFPAWGGAHCRYRRRMLDGAKAYAKSEGRPGARYPWQTSIEGFEHAPVAITCSRTQIHVTVDVAYCALRYADISGDFQWLETKGKEVVTECARYMAERVIFNAAEDRYEIHGVGGPDEYHPVTDNNAYTNYLTAYVLCRAAKLNDHPVEAKKWLEISEKMYCPVDEKTGLIPQCDGFYDLKDTWNVTGGEWGGPGAEYHECKGMKQPDVILLLTLMPEKFERKHLQANWDYYERFILHGSSLSPSIHALVAAKLGMLDRAMHYFDLSANFDFVDYNKDTYAGIHIGNFGGLWQALVYGFAGLELHGDTLRFNPHLPENWKSLSFNLSFRGETLRVKVADGQATVTPPPEIKGVLFDLDGVVVFTDKYHYLGWKKLADEKGWAFDEEINDGCRGVPRLASLQVILDHNKVDMPLKEKEQLADVKNEYYKKLLMDINDGDLYPGVIDLLKKLKQDGLKLAICSSSKNAQTVLDALDLSKYFDAVIGGNDIENPKPHPEIFLTGAGRIGLSPEECVVFEDAESGVAAALAAGMKCVGVGPQERLGAANLCLTDYSSFDVAVLV